MRPLILAPFLFALGCASAPASSGSDQTAAAPTPAPDNTKKISGTVIAFGTHPNLNYQYVVLTYLDDDGMLRSEAFPGQGIEVDLAMTNRYARRVHLGWIPKEGDRFRMSKDEFGNYDVNKIEEQ